MNKYPPEPPTVTDWLWVCAIVLDPEFSEPGPLTITKGQKRLISAALRRVQGDSDGGFDA